MRGILHEVFSCEDLNVLDPAEKLHVTVMMKLK